MKNRIIIDFTSWRDAELDRDARIIAGSMKDNPHFQMLAAQTDAVAKAAAAYSDALVAAARGNSEAHSSKNDKRKALEKALRILGFNINQVAEGNRTLLESTGFPLAREGAPGRKAKAPLEVEAGTGQVTVSFKRVDGAAVHFLEYTEAPVTDGSRWIRRHTPHTSMTIGGLASGHKYAFRIAGILDESDPVFGEPVVSKFVE